MTERTCKPIRCPGCRSLRILLCEHIDCITQWDTGDATQGYHHAGSYYKVMATCEDCGKHWRLRGHVQVCAGLRERLTENARLIREVQKP